MADRASHALFNFPSNKVRTVEFLLYLVLMPQCFSA